MKHFSTLTRCSLSAVLVASFLLVSGCSSKNKSTKAAAGAAKPTTKQPASTPKPSKKTGSNVSSNQASAAPVAADPACTAEEEGLAACAGTFAVFCAGTKVYAIDCAEAFGGTCAELDGAIDCVVEVEE